MLPAPPVPGQSPVRQPAPCILHTQMCSGVSFGNSIEKMSDQKISTYVGSMLENRNIPEWLRPDAQNPTELRKYALDLLIAPMPTEIKHLEREDLIMCIAAMEDQNEVSHSKCKNIEDSTPTQQLREYVAWLLPDPIREDLYTMTQGRLVATATKMYRDLCIPPTEQPDLRKWNRHEIIEHAEKLLARYPSLRFPHENKFADNIWITYLAKAVHLPDKKLQEILSTDDSTLSIAHQRYEKMKHLETLFHSVPSINNTEFPRRIENWIDFENSRIENSQIRLRVEKGWFLELTICKLNTEAINAKQTCYAPVGHVLDADIKTGPPRYYESSPWPRFSLRETFFNMTASARTVTQFITVEFGLKNKNGEEYCVLRVYKAPKIGEAVNTLRTYHIPCQDADREQKKKLRKFLGVFGTKVGEKYNLLGKATGRQYRAHDPTDRMRHDEARLALDKALGDKDDLVEKIPGNALARPSLT